MVDVVSAISAAAAIETPATVNLTNPEHPAMSSTPRFRIRDFLAGVLSDLVPLFERDRGKATFAVNWRGLDS
jgi:hypothetical protein